MYTVAHHHHVIVTEYMQPIRVLSDETWAHHGRYDHERHVTYVDFESVKDAMAFIERCIERCRERRRFHYDEPGIALGIDDRPLA